MEAILLPFGTIVLKASAPIKVSAFETGAFRSGEHKTLNLTSRHRDQSNTASLFIESGLRFSD